MSNKNKPFACELHDSLGSKYCPECGLRLRGAIDSTATSVPEVVHSETEPKDVKMTFGLQPHHIEAIEKEIERFGKREFEATFVRYIWDKLGKELGWEPFTLALYYFEYLSDKRKSELREAVMKAFIAGENNGVNRDYKFSKVDKEGQLRDTENYLNSINL